MTEPPRTVSVVIPTHNRARLLPLTLFSVLRQHAIDLEVIVVDDGSTEDIGRTVHELGDPRVRLLRHQTPQGVSVARNHGVAKAQGRWIACLDDDDLWAPNKLTAQIDAAAGEDARWVYAGAVNVTEDLRLLGGAPPADPDEVVEALPRTNLVPGGCSSVMVRRDLLPPDPFDPSLGTCADWDLWIRLSRLARPIGVTQPLVGYRVHDNNMSMDTLRTISELSAIEARYYFQAATVDRKYRSGDFLPDLFEVAQGVGHSISNRIARTLVTAPPTGRRPRPGRRDAAQWAWVEQARPWIDELAAYRHRLPDPRHP